MSDPARVWEQRWHPFRGEWVLFTSHRGGRPWLGETRRPTAGEVPSYNPSCALCPRNERLNGRRNPDYRGAYWFENDLPCFGADAPEPGAEDPDPLYRRRAARGRAEVVCYHEDHSRTMADLSRDEVRAVVELWCDRSEALAQMADVELVLIFENKGELVGTSNPHPHGQIYAGSLVYGIMAREDDVARDHWRRTGRAIGQDVFEREAKGPRVVAQAPGWIACVPWFARYAYEVLILPERPIAQLPELSPPERDGLAAVLREVTIRYDNLWQMPFPYVMAIHQAPCDGREPAPFPCHIAFQPPLRKPDTMKYLAGPEVGGGSMTNESDPDAKAAELQAASSERRRVS